MHTFIGRSLFSSVKLCHQKGHQVQILIQQWWPSLLKKTRWCSVVNKKIEAIKQQHLTWHSLFPREELECTFCRDQNHQRLCVWRERICGFGLRHSLCLGHRCYRTRWGVNENITVIQRRSSRWVQFKWGVQGTETWSRGCSFCISRFSLGGTETVKGKSDWNLDIQEFGVRNS